MAVLDSEFIARCDTVMIHGGIVAAQHKKYPALIHYYILALNFIKSNGGLIMTSDYRHVKEKFDDYARQYDAQRSMLIPCFNDFYSIAVSLADTDNQKPDILDIGAGTGLLSSMVLRKFPDARLTLIDISEKMLEVAKERLKAAAGVIYIVDDYTKHRFDKTYDIVLSSLSIHHLPDKQKKQLFQTIYSILNPGGMFINADQVLGSTPFLETLYKKDWKRKVENSALTTKDLQSAYERTKLDRMARLEDQLRWLEEVGFSDVDCVYKYFNFVVMFGRKINDS